MGVVRCGRHNRICCWRCDGCPSCNESMGKLLRGHYCKACTAKNKAEGLVWSENHKNWVSPETKKGFEDYLVQQELFREEHKGDYLVLSAFGDWHEKVPAGSVGVFAGLGGRTKDGHYPADVKWFLVPKAEYLPGMVLKIGEYPEIEAL